VKHFEKLMALACIGLMSVGGVAHAAKGVDESAVVDAFEEYNRNPTTQNLEAFKKLLKSGGNANAMSRGEPLIFGTDSPEMVKVLLANGANAKVSNGSFTVLTGSTSGATANLEVIKLFIAAGVDPYAVTDVGSTALHFVCARKYEQEGQPDPQAAERIALLKPKTGSIDTHYPQRRAHPVGTPLLEATLTKNPDCVKALLAAGAQPDAIAYPDEYIKADPNAKGVTVRQDILKSAKEYPSIYDPVTLRLFAKK